MNNAEYFCYKQPITTDCFSEYAISNINEKSSIIILVEQDFKGLDYLRVRLESSENEDFENYNIIVEQTIHRNNLKEGTRLIVTFIPKETLGCTRLRFHTSGKTCTQGLITVMLKRENCNILEERKLLVHTDEYSIGEDGLIDSKIPLTDVCYKLALQLQQSKTELEQYKKSKQASYESMQIEWNNAINELRDLKATDRIEFKQQLGQKINRMNIKPVNGTWVNEDDIKPFTMSTSTNTEVRKMLACWCIDFMSKIEEIAHKKYPNTTYWCDTGSRWNAIMAMLQKFEDDLKVRK